MEVWFNIKILNNIWSHGHQAAIPLVKAHDLSLSLFEFNKRGVGMDH